MARFLYISGPHGGRICLWILVFFWFVECVRADVGPTMLQDGTANIIAAMKANGCKRISVVTTIGAGDSMDQASWGFKLLMNTVMKTVMEDKNKQQEEQRHFFAGAGWGRILR